MFSLAVFPDFVETLSHTEVLRSLSRCEHTGSLHLSKGVCVFFQPLRVPNFWGLFFVQGKPKGPLGHVVGFAAYFETYRFCERAMWVCFLLGVPVVCRMFFPRKPCLRKKSKPPQMALCCCFFWEKAKGKQPKGRFSLGKPKGTPPPLSRAEQTTRRARASGAEDVGRRPGGAGGAEKLRVSGGRSLHDPLKRVNDQPLF